MVSVNLVERKKKQKKLRLLSDPDAYFSPQVVPHCILLCLLHFPRPRTSTLLCPPTRLLTLLRYNLLIIAKISIISVQLCLFSIFALYTSTTTLVNAVFYTTKSAMR